MFHQTLWIGELQPKETLGSQKQPRKLSLCSIELFSIEESEAKDFETLVYKDLPSVKIQESKLKRLCTFLKLSNLYPVI